MDCGESRFADILGGDLNLQVAVVVGENKGILEVRIRAVCDYSRGIRAAVVYGVEILIPGIEFCIPNSGLGIC